MSKPNYKGIEGKARILLNMLSDPAVIIDQKGLFLMANDAFGKETGLKPRELIGTPFLKYDVLPAESKAKLLQNLSKQLQGSPVAPYEVQYINAAGEKRFVEVKGQRINYAGQPADLVVLHDVTRRKEDTRQLEEYAERMEALVEEKIKEIKESEEKFRAITNSAFDAVLMFDKEDTIVYWNPAAEKTFGYTEKEIVGKQVNATLVPPRFRKDHLKLAEKIAKVEEKEHTGQILELPAVRKGGAEFSMELSMAPLQLNDKTYFVAIVRDITERKEKEKALRESEERFKQVAENAEEWIWEVDAQGMYTYSSPLVEKTLGYKPEEIVGKKRFYDLFHPENREELMKAALKAFKQKQPFHSFINKNVHKNGETVWLSTSGVPILDQQGKLVGYRGADSNITELKKAEEALRSAEHKFRNLFEKANDAFIHLDKFGRILDVNAKAIEMFGGSKEELLGKHFTKIGIFSVKNIPILMRNFTRILTGKEVNIELPIKNKMQQQIILECSATLLKTKESPGMIIVARDITERKKAEQALVESEAKFRTLAEQSPYMVFVNKKGRVVYANKMCEETMGYTKEEFYSPSFNFFCLIAPESREQIKSVYEQHIKNEKDVGPLEYRLLTKNGRIRDALLTSRLITYEGDKAIMGIVVDITERIKMQKKLEKYSRHLEEIVEKKTKQLKKAQANLLKAERLAAIGELAGMVGHDLRNPLTAIKNAAYYLKVKRSSSFDANSKKMLEIIDNAVIRADKIIGDLQEYSREMHLDLAHFSPRSILKEALTLVQIPDRVKIVDNVPDEPLIRADKTKLVRVFMNIIKNAFDAMPDGGTLKIKSVQANGNVEISFADTGMGIPKEDLTTLFSPLVTTKAQGMGFGLAICKRIVDAHQGQITVQSVEGKGSTFTVIIPIEPKPKDASEPAWINLPKSFPLKKKKKQKAKTTK